ncbi:hypothetical protein [Halioxenophilus aromaticivorans]|uniref:Uncharacterized protein n=1 Tax=Halioxenophilus aromaticivorans TaxID=1306992 RepID=A0AAV3TXC3_9ALTE
MHRVNTQRLELEYQIHEMEHALASLKVRLHEVEEDEQHQAIDHLEDCLDEVDHRFSNLRDFGQLLLSDTRRLFGLHR